MSEQLGILNIRPRCFNSAMNRKNWTTQGQLGTFTAFMNEDFPELRTRYLWIEERRSKPFNQVIALIYRFQSTIYIARLTSQILPFMDELQLSNPLHGSGLKLYSQLSIFHCIQVWVPAYLLLNMYTLSIYPSVDNNLTVTPRLDACERISAVTRITIK